MTLPVDVWRAFVEFWREEPYPEEPYPFEQCGRFPACQTAAVANEVVRLLRSDVIVAIGRAVMITDRSENYTPAQRIAIHQMAAYLEQTLHLPVIH